MEKEENTTRSKHKARNLILKKHCATAKESRHREGCKAADSDKKLKKMRNPLSST